MDFMIELFSFIFHVGLLAIMFLAIRDLIKQTQK